MALISFVVTAKLICVFVFAYAKRRFSHDEAHIKFDEVAEWSPHGKGLLILFFVYSLCILSIYSLVFNFKAEGRTLVLIAPVTGPCCPFTIKNYTFFWLHLYVIYCNFATLKDSL